MIVINAPYAVRSATTAGLRVYSVGYFMNRALLLNSDQLSAMV